jgi:hypothetical protein
VKENNTTFTGGLYTSTILLLRKLLENLLIDILKNKYPSRVATKQKITKKMIELSI